MKEFLLMIARTPFLSFFLLGVLLFILPVGIINLLKIKRKIFGKIYLISLGASTFGYLALAIFHAAVFKYELKTLIPEIGKDVLPYFAVAETLMGIYFFVVWYDIKQKIASIEASRKDSNQPE